MRLIPLTLKESGERIYINPSQVCAFYKSAIKEDDGATVVQFPSIIGSPIVLESVETIASMMRRSEDGSQN